MKIIHTVEKYLPELNGMSEVVKQISENLVLRGHEVIILTSSHPNRNEDTYINGVRIISFDLSGKLVTGIDGNKSRYIDFLLNEEYDVIANFAAQQWATDLCFDLLHKLKAKKIFIPTGFSELLNPKYSLYFKKMKSWMKNYDSVVFLSEMTKDFNFAKAGGVQSFTIIPNGASLSEFIGSESNILDELKISNSTKIILHIGSYTGLKGHDQALDIFLKSQYQDSILIFVGQNLDKFESIFFRMRLNFFLEMRKNFTFSMRALKAFFKYILYFFSNKKHRIKVLTLERARLVQLMKKSDIFLFPSLIECSPVVVFESMAAGLPFIATDVGNIKEIQEKSNSGEILPTLKVKNNYVFADISKSAKALDSLLNDEVKLNLFKENGYNFWIKDYTWEEISKKYENLYKNLCLNDSN